MIPVESWRARGRTISTIDGKVFVVDLGSRDTKLAPIVVLHGFPTSSWDFAGAAEILARDRRVVLFDFLGFGFSDKPPEHGYSLFEHADTTLLVARELGISRAHVWAHDMGTSVATELLARRERGVLPFELASLVLMNGSVHIEMAHLTIGQQILRSPLGPVFARLNNRITFKAQMRRIFGRPPADEELDGMWDLVAREDGPSRLPQTILYTGERARFRRRWIGALERFDRPALVAWGRRDPVAILAIAEQLAREIRGAELITWNDLGHYPQVEDTAQVTKDIAAFWDRVG
jgi:pimeloyl-ACP methyl ester carboxylesterase